MSYRTLAQGAYRTALTAAMMAVTSFSAGAQGLNLKQILVISPYVGGGTSDIAIRKIVQRVSETSTIKFVIEGRPGGAGAIAAAAVKASPPDGSVLMLADAGTFAYNVTINPNLPYSPEKDFEPITTLWAVPNVLVVASATPANSIKELLAYGQTKPNGLTYASQSSGSTGHVLGSILAHISNQKMVHVAYRGSTPAATDVAGGFVDLLFSSYPTFRGLIDSGKLKILATTSKVRDPNYPNASTVIEQGFPQLELEIWFGVAAPGGTPRDIVKGLNTLFTSAARMPDLVKDLADQGIPVTTNTPEEFRKLISDDIAKFRPILEKAGAVMK